MQKKPLPDTTSHYIVDSKPIIYYILCSDEKPTIRETMVLRIVDSETTELIPDSTSLDKAQTVVFQDLRKDCKSTGFSLA